MGRQLVALFDGTWSDPQDGTSVSRLARAILDAGDPAVQRVFYEPGLGTATFTRLRGGLFGHGLSASLGEGYRWLARRYQEGDQLWIFGFSRGAYTARSLVGLIRKCGLVRHPESYVLTAAERLYRAKSIAPEHPEARAFRDRHAREIGIHFLGVWDTVGSLGIPGTLISERGLYAWHDTRLSKIVANACHAMALDEHRAVFDAVPWTAPDGLPKSSQQCVEQRWFCGSHGNVGGGYGIDPLADLPFAWIVGQARSAGLPLAPFVADPTAHLAPVRDAYAEFAGGVYQLLRRLRHGRAARHYRRYAADSLGEPAINVSVDPSVWARWRASADYRPPTLLRAGLAPPLAD